MVFIAYDCYAVKYGIKKNPNFFVCIFILYTFHIP